MKILAVKTHYMTPSGEMRLSSVDWWRIVNPLTHLLKHTDYHIDFVNKVVREDHAELDYDKIGKEYDLLWTSYIDTPKGYSWIKAVKEKYGMKHIMDLDDNILQVDEMNPSYVRYYPGSPHLQNAMIILQDVDLLTVTVPYLKELISTFRDKPIEILPNYIDQNVYKYISKNVPDNKDRVVIGYQGSATHYTDIFKTSFIWGLRRVMKKYPQVDFAIIGSAFEELDKYLPKERVKLLSGAPDHMKWVEKWQELPFDIGVAPLAMSPFNKGKSEIKYYEYALRKIPGVYSFFDPYLRVVKENETGFLAQDEDEWVEKLSWLIENKTLRKKMGDQARNDVLTHYSIHNHWQLWQKQAEDVLSW